MCGLLLGDWSSILFPPEHGRILGSCLRGCQHQNYCIVKSLLCAPLGKDITELIAAGREKLASVPSVGGGGAVVVAAAGSGGCGTTVAAPAAEEAKKEEKVEEKEELDDDMDFSLFD
ncbi:hypothetical protein AMTRI_Chr08g205850 [Amborella trichopoda]